jgi:hypothetical protein
VVPGKEKHSSKFVNPFHPVGGTSLSNGIASGMRRVIGDIGLSRTSYIIVYFAWYVGEEVEVGDEMLLSKPSRFGVHLPTFQLEPKNFLEIISLKSILQHSHFRQFLRGSSPSSLIP